MDPLDLSASDEISFTTGLEIQVVVADPAQVMAAVKEHYGEDEADAAAGGAALEEILKEMGADSSDESVEEEDIVKIDVTGDERDIAAFVDAVLVTAIGDRASDIHFEPFENDFKIRARVDGALYELTSPPKEPRPPTWSAASRSWRISSRTSVAGHRMGASHASCLTAERSTCVFPVYRHSLVNLSCCVC